MAWPYHFVDPNALEKQRRRELLDRYATYAQLSALLPVLLYQLYRLGVWVRSERQRSKAAYSAVPSSPALKKSRQSSAGAADRKWRALLWSLEDEVKEGWGSKGQWVAAAVWTSWLLFLCIHKTGDDYMHITKRFGIVAASQMPLHFMLSMKSVYSPLAIAFQSSHEQLNRWHRTLGRMIYFLLLLHGTWYLNFFIVKGILLSKLKAPVIIIGLAGLVMFSVIATTSLAAVRHWNFRLFFLIHLTLGIGLLPLLFFHASALRLYTIECLAIFGLDLLARKLDTYTSFTKITAISGTRLVKLTIPLPPAKWSRFKQAAGQHVYLSIPSESVPTNGVSPLLHELLFNPFTVAKVSAKEVTLVLRALNGPVTTALEKLSKLTKARPPINIEGPYGSSRHFPKLALNFDRILLVSGGVGATFILPVYQSLRKQMVDDGRNPDRVSLAWSMRSAAEASWALDEDLQKDENVKIFVTNGHDVSPLPADGSVELRDLQARPAEQLFIASGGYKRPDLKKLVDEVFSHGVEESVAVLVCGPKGMAREVRGLVGRWVGKGRYVWWHDESFGA